MRLTLRIIICYSYREYVNGKQVGVPCYFISNKTQIILLSREIYLLLC